MLIKLVFILDYISLFIEKLKSILEQGHASMAPKIILVIYNNNQLVHSSSSSYVPSSQVLEKYTIEMDLFFPQTQDISVDDLQVHLRSLLLKLSTISNKISSLPSLLTSDISWRLWINTGQESHPPLSSSLSDPNFFVPSPTNGTELDMNKSSSHCIALQSLPVSPSCNVQILVQEDIVSKKQLHNTANDSLFLSFPGSSLAA